MTKVLISPKVFFSNIKKSIAGKSKVDASFLDELEEIFVGADVEFQLQLR